MSDLSTTTEQDHVHVCPACGDVWRHACDECATDGKQPPTFYAWAVCPMCERPGSERG